MLMLILLCAATLLGCGRRAHVRVFRAEQGTESRSAFELVEPGSLQSNGHAIWGSGSLVFAEPLPDIFGDNRYRFAFRLAPGASLAFVTHADAGLGGGLELALERPDAKGELHAELRGPTVTHDVSDAFRELSDDETLTLLVDVANPASGTARVLVWNASPGDASSSPEPPEPLLDTADRQLTLQPTPEQRWGFHLRDAAVIEPLREPGIVASGGDE
jgi:hypothetical protein